MRQVGRMLWAIGRSIEKGLYKVYSKKVYLTEPKVWPDTAHDSTEPSEQNRCRRPGARRKKGSATHTDTHTQTC